MADETGIALEGWCPTDEAVHLAGFPDSYMTGEWITVLRRQTPQQQIDDGSSVCFKIPCSGRKEIW